jgi:hypothetical protein
MESLPRNTLPFPLSQYGFERKKKLGQIGPVYSGTRQLTRVGYQNKEANTRDLAQYVPDNSNRIEIVRSAGRFYAGCAKSTCPNSKSTKSTEIDSNSKSDTNFKSSLKIWHGRAN